ncbi:MAG TPA: nucleotidyltransferase, partial [Rubrivivax sp.]|nr:nucleotidyltransferase [Rubrivivax sp.]
MSAVNSLASVTPSSNVMAMLQAELARHPPFSQMTEEHARRFVAAAAQAYFAPGETVFDPADGAVAVLCFVRRGAVSAGADQAVVGDLFPL